MVAGLPNRHQPVLCIDDARCGLSVEFLVACRIKVFGRFVDRKGEDEQCGCDRCQNGHPDQDALVPMQISVLVQERCAHGTISPGD